MVLLTEKDIGDLALGAAVLGTGGGGDPYTGMLMARQAIREKGPVELVDPEEVGKDSFIIASAFMGAPLTLIEKLPGGKEAVRALEGLESYHGRRADYLTPIEIGGMNSTIPVYTAALTGKPLLDGDGMGRAFPELQMVTFHLYGVSATPMSMADEKGNTVILDTIDNYWAERIARAVTIRMGGWASIAIYAMNGGEYRKAVVKNTITRAIEIGRSIREAKNRGKTPLRAVLEATGGYLLFKGKMVDVKRWISQGFAKGEIVMEGLEEYNGKTMRIAFQNENLVAMMNGEVKASVPDLIVVLDLETGEPITTERHRYGYRAAVIGIPCDEKWRTEEALRVVGPRYFGYNIEYIPVEKLNG